jgi:hypothetical protein
MPRNSRRMIEMIGSNFTGNIVRKWEAASADQMPPRSLPQNQLAQHAFCRDGTDSATLRRTNLCDRTVVPQPMFIWCLCGG